MFEFSNTEPGHFSLLDRLDLTQSRKDANKKEWYRHHLGRINITGVDTLNVLSGFETINTVSRRHQLKINYDLYNNILDVNDMKRFCQIGGFETELPSNMVNRDLISRKLKVLEGIETKRPFTWRLVAVNPEATTRKEEKKFSMMRDYVVQEIRKGIELEIRTAKQKENEGKELTKEQQQEIEKQIEEEIQAKTPIDIEVYMQREHQDPAEILGNHLLNYLKKELDLVYKFDKGWKHSNKAGLEVYYLNEFNNDIKFEVINPLNFDYALKPNSEFIEESDWCVYLQYLTPSDILERWGSELKKEEIDDIFKGNVFNYNYASSDAYLNPFNNTATQYDFDNYNINKNKGIPVKHGVWRALKKIGYLSYINPETQQLEETIVNDDYKFNEKAGDVDIEWKWIPELHEGYQIGTTIFVGMGPVKNQFITIEDFGKVQPMPYMGVLYDNSNTRHPTSFLDRLKPLQYYYNIIMYRIELLMSSDQGKILMMNLEAIPKEAGLDLEKWFYYLKTSKIGFYNGSSSKSFDSTVGAIAKEIDMSLSSQINRYIELAQYIEQKAGEVVGINPQMEGDVGTHDSVRNTQTALQQSSNILEPAFTLHNKIKERVITRLLDLAKIVYNKKDIDTLNYVLDDQTLAMVKMDKELLQNSKYGLFVSNTTKAWEIKQVIEQLAHAAMQNQTINMSDVIEVLRSDDLFGAKETLIKSEIKKAKRDEQINKQQQEHEMRMQEENNKAMKELQDFELKKIITKGEQDRLTEKVKGDIDLQKQVMLSVGFDTNKDVDNDGIPDVIELYKEGIKADVKNKELKLKDKELNLKEKEIDLKNENEKAKINIMRNKT